MNSFFRGTSPRVYVDGAPHTIADVSLTLSRFHGFDASLRYRHASGYRLDGEDARVRASSLDVLDFAVSKRLSRWLDFNLAVDNLAGKRYYGTQNYFESRLRPGHPPRLAHPRHARLPHHGHGGLYLARAQQVEGADRPVRGRGARLDAPSRASGDRH